MLMLVFKSINQSSLFLSFLPSFFYICWTIKINLFSEDIVDISIQCSLIG